MEASGGPKILLEIGHSYKEYKGTPNESPERYFERVMEHEQLIKSLELEGVKNDYHSLKAMDGTVS